jgi:hypothetical protein
MKIEKTLPCKDYSIGTKVHAIGGGWWCKTKNGWKWGGPNGSGGTFPLPGGDIARYCIELSDGGKE